MATKNDRHILPTKDGRWENRRVGTQKGSVYETQYEAIDAARQSLRRTGGLLVIHNAKGKVRRQDNVPSTR